MFKLIKRVIMATFMIYTFNMISVNFNIVLPINIWTILFTSIFDISGLIVAFILKTVGV